jgi:hypothetical protein
VLVDLGHASGPSLCFVDRGSWRSARVARRRAARLSPAGIDPDVVYAVALGGLAQPDVPRARPTFPQSSTAFFWRARTPSHCTAIVAVLAVLFSCLPDGRTTDGGNSFQRLGWAPGAADAPANALGASCSAGPSDKSHTPATTAHRRPRPATSRSCAEPGCVCGGDGRRW